jgi:hypothetical protein
MTPFRENPSVALLPDDRMLARYLRFVRQYPRLDPRAVFMSD